MYRSDVCAQNWLNVTNPLGEISPFISTAIINIAINHPTTNFSSEQLEYSRCAKLVETNP